MVGLWTGVNTTMIKIKEPVDVSNGERRSKNLKSTGIAARVRQMGPWNQQVDARLLAGPTALPMPVEISERDTLRPIFRHLEMNGDISLLGEEEAALARNELSVSHAHEANCTQSLPS